MVKKGTSTTNGTKTHIRYAFKISYIDKQGEIETFKRSVCGEEFEAMISIMKFQSKKTFIYDATMTECNSTFQQETSFSQNSIHSFNSNNFNFQNFNQVHFGTHGNVNNLLNNSVNHNNDCGIDDGRFYSL